LTDKHAFLHRIVDKRRFLYEFVGVNIRNEISRINKFQVTIKLLLECFIVRFGPPIFFSLLHGKEQILEVAWMYMYEPEDRFKLSLLLLKIG